VHCSFTDSMQDMSTSARAYGWHLHAAVTVGRDSGSAATPPNMTPDLPVEHNCAACALTTNGTKSSGKPSPLPGTHWYKPPGRCDRLHSGLRDHASHSGMLAQLQACADAVSKVDLMSLETSETSSLVMFFFQHTY
jgi:hypothetical protein